MLSVPPAEPSHSIHSSVKETCPNIYMFIYIYVYIYLNFSQSTTIFLVYIMFNIYKIRATSFGFMPSSGPL